MDHGQSRNTVDEVRTRRLVLVDSEARARLVMEIVTTGDVRNGGVVGAPRISFLTAHGKEVLVLEIDARDMARIRIGSPDQGSIVEVEEGQILLGSDGNTRVSISVGLGGGVLDLCDEDGVPVLRLPAERE